MACIDALRIFATRLPCMARVYDQVCGPSSYLLVFGLLQLESRGRSCRVVQQQMRSLTVLAPSIALLSFQRISGDRWVVYSCHSISVTNGHHSHSVSSPSTWLDSFKSWKLEPSWPFQMTLGACFGEIGRVQCSSNFLRISFATDPGSLSKRGRK